MGRNIDKYRGVMPAFYACYDANGAVDTGRCKALARWLLEKGVRGLYLCGSSGECVCQSVEERMKILAAVMEEVRGRLTVIAHVGASNTKDACTLAEHAASLGVDAIASIPPLYYRLPPHAIADYWNAISGSAPDTDFIIYNIPQLTGVSLTPQLLERMLQNPNAAGVKNSSMPVVDIELFKRLGGDSFAVFNGPDEQYAAGRVAGADGGIGGTYAVMPELFMAIDSALEKGDILRAQAVQREINPIIEQLVGGDGCMYALAKAVLRLQGIDIGSVRAPLHEPSRADELLIAESHARIETAKKLFS